jgi:hypothetical protein
MPGCSICDVGLGGKTVGGKKRKGSRSDKMFGGATTTNLSLNPASLTGDSFDSDGDKLANIAYGRYINDSSKLASLKNVNAMAGGGMAYENGGGKKKRSRTAKKYRSKSKSRQQRGGYTTREKASFILDSPRTEKLCEYSPKIKEIVDKLKKANSESRTPFDKKSEELIEDFNRVVKKLMEEEEEGQAGGRKQRGGILELGALLNEAAVPLTLLAAQQKYKQRTTKGYKGKGRKSRKFRRSMRR